MSNIDSMLKEKRVFKPAKAFAAQAHIPSAAAYESLCRQARKNPEAFWGKLAKEHLAWFSTWTKTLIWKAPFAQWFVGGKINLSVNCLDRHVASARRNKAAILWEGEPGDKRVLTYQELADEVGRLANGLKSLGLKKGDRVGIYMPMVPEAAVAMLACARLGLTHSVVFGGFSAQALRDRMNDAQAKAILTADGGYRRGAVVALKAQVDEALKDSPTVQHVVVLKRTGQAIPMTEGRDVWWHDLVPKQSSDCAPEKTRQRTSAFHPLHLGHDRQAQGHVVHSTAGYLLGAMLTTKWVFDLKDPEDIFWCTADIGWVTGHSYVVYGPLANGATVLMYAKARRTIRNPDRFWALIERWKVNIFYTAPTAIRAFMRWGRRLAEEARPVVPASRLGSVGEPINPEAWMWYQRVVGGGKCPIVDTWWQTETGAIMISPLPGATPTKPGSATKPLPGIEADIVTREGKPIGAKEEAVFLILKKPWPSMLRGIWGDPARFKEQYWSQIPGAYFTGDGARRDKDGYFWVMGRVDDVINVAGHRLGTMEIESALVSHPAVAEAAVVGKPDELKGTAIAAFVTLKSGQATTDELKKELIQHVAKEIGSIAKPDDLRFH